MKNIDVFAETQGLTEELVKQVAEDKASEQEAQVDPNVLLKDLFDSAPRKLKRQLAPNKKFTNKLLEKMRQKRLDTK